MASLALSGCMVSPGDGDHIGHYATPVHPGGFTLTPHQLVLVEAWDPKLNYWVIIQFDFTDNAPTPYQFDGKDWYHWQVSSLSIPRKYWDGVGTLNCKLRATVNGNAIGTFTNWHSCFHPRKSLGQLWSECGAGASMTIYGYELN